MGAGRELSRAEDMATQRASAIGRIDDFLGTVPADLVARQPDANDVNAWWEDIFLPSTQGLPAEDRMIRRLGLVPAVILTAARGLLYSKDPAEVAKGALRLASLMDDLPEGAIMLNPREAGAVRAVSDAAKDLPTPALAVARAGLELLKNKRPFQRQI